MLLLFYWTEAKTRAVYLFVSFFFTFICSYVHIEDILFLLSFHVEYSNQYIYTSMNDVMEIYILVSFLLSVYVLFYSVLISSYLYVHPMLYRREQKKILLNLVFFILFMMFSSFFTIYYIIQKIYQYLISFEKVGNDLYASVQLFANLKTFYAQYLITFSYITVFYCCLYVIYIMLKNRILNISLLFSNRHIFIFLFILLNSFLGFDVIWLLSLSVLFWLVIEAVIFFLYFYYIQYSYFISNIQ
jgi:hypothetical protein